MMRQRLLCIAILMASMGCAGDVTTTEDSTKMEVETPKVEVGDKAPDLDPTTDEDVDIDTPAAGDK